MTQASELVFKGPVPAELDGQRLDRALVALVPGISRSRLQQWLRDGRVQVNDAVALRVRQPVAAGDVVAVARPPVATADPLSAQSMALDIVHEDATLLIVNKPPGLVVHPGAGNPDGTLLNGLLHHAPELADLPRAGLVHRLDKDTSGLLVVARTLQAHATLVAAMQRREIKREYDTVVIGEMISGGTAEFALGRHPVDRTRMAVRERGRRAVTHYRIHERWRGFTRLHVQLETGRTHQIRVHMAALGFPVLGDPLYGGRQRWPAGISDALRATLAGFGRQALHACRLTLTHPLDGEQCAWSAPLPGDMAHLVDILRESNS